MTYASLSAPAREIDDDVRGTSCSCLGLLSPVLNTWSCGDLQLCGICETKSLIDSHCSHRLTGHPHSRLDSK